MTQNAGVAAGGRLTDRISLGVLASAVPRDAVDDAIAGAGRQARRRDGKLPPHVVVYLVMALALFGDEDYEEVAARLTETLSSWGCWDDSWSLPTSGGITQARQRLGPEPLELLYGKVAGLLTRGAFVRDWRLMAIDGFELDVPDTPANAAAFGYSSGEDRSAFPKVRVVTIGECGSHAKVDAQIGPAGGKGSCEQALARRMYPRLEEGWLLIADRCFCNWPDWQAAAQTGAALLWRVKSDLNLPVLALLPDGSYASVLVNPQARRPVRARLTAAARAGEDLDPAQAARVRDIEYQVPGRDSEGNDELIALITTITDPADATAQELAGACHQRREEETGNDQLKTHLRGPGTVLRSKSPDMVRQEIYGYLLTHYAISALICRAATEADITRTGSSSYEPSASSAAGPLTRPFPPERQERSLAAVMADITRPRNLNPRRRHRSYPRVIRRARHNSYRVNRPGDAGVRYHGPPTIRLVNLRPQSAMINLS